MQADAVGGNLSTTTKLFVLEILVHNRDDRVSVLFELNTLSIAIFPILSILFHFTYVIYIVLFAEINLKRLNSNGIIKQQHKEIGVLTNDCCRFG